MRFSVLILLLSFSLFAENMTLGPYNEPEFKTQQKLIQEKKAREKKASLKNKKALEAYEKRRVELAEIHKKEEQALREKIQRQEQKEQEQRDEIARNKTQDNLQQAQQEERQKQEFIKKEEETFLAAKASQRAEDEDEYTLDLTPEQAGMSINNPDDIETELDNIDRLRYLILHSKNTPEFIKDYIHFLNSLKDDYNLDIGFSYHSIVQAELDEEIVGAGGKYDMTARYRPKEGTDIAMRLEGRHQIGKYSSTEFKNEIGSITNTSASYRREDIYLAQLWIQEEIDAFTIRAGKLDPTSYIDSHLFKSTSRFFFNSTFSGSPYNAFPPLGLGVAGKYEKEDYYISSEITDANAVSGGSNHNVFDGSDFYSALEFGLTPDDGSKYHLSAWHRDKSNTREEMQGMVASFVQVLNYDTHLIIRGAFSDHATAKRYTSVGLGRMSLFKEHDISGLAVGTLVPSNESERTQTSIESFYRIDPLPGVQLSADLQLIYHPSRGTQTWALLPGLRLRVLF